jgi:hypothetical protein
VAPSYGESISITREEISNKTLCFVIQSIPSMISIPSCDSSSTCKLGTVFVSVKYVLVSLKLMCVYVKLLKT